MDASLNFKDKLFLGRRRKIFYRILPCIVLILAMIAIFYLTKIHISLANKDINEKIATIRNIDTLSPEEEKLKKMLVNYTELIKSLSINLYWHRTYIVFVVILFAILHHIIGYFEDKRYLGIIDKFLAEHKKNSLLGY